MLGFGWIKRPEDASLRVHPNPFYLDEFDQDPAGRPFAFRCGDTNTVVQEQAMNRKNDRSRALAERAEAVLSGPQSNLRIPLSIAPTYIVRGGGTRLWDADGKEFIDYMIAAGAGILGHSNSEYLQAVSRQLERLYYSVSGATQTPMEVALAEKIVHHVPCAEKVRFGISGSEAVQLAIRLARGYTGRRIFVRFEGSYHGWLDNVLGGKTSKDPVRNPHPLTGEDDPLGTEGRDPGAFLQSFRLPWNDFEVIEQVLQEHWRDVAMVLVEPVQAAGCFEPMPGFLEHIRRLCDQYGIVLCFDEVVTGFRLAMGGAQEVYGVTPDLATYGKALAGGLPLSAIAGRADIMDLLTSCRVVGAGTFNGYPLGTAAALATISILEGQDCAYFFRVDSAQNYLMNRLREIGRSIGTHLLVHGVRGLFVTHFTNRGHVFSVRDLSDTDQALQNRLRVLLAEEGVLIMWGGRWYVTGAHTEIDLEETLIKAERAFEKLFEEENSLWKNS